VDFRRLADASTAKAARSLTADLQDIVSAGLLQEVRSAGEPTRYALTKLGEKLALNSNEQE
jgi:hypothetical protein